MTVFDSSALLALLKGEPGGEQVREMIAEGDVCGAANWSEVAQKVRAAGADWSLHRAILGTLGIDVEPVGEADAVRAAAMWQPGVGLSLADRLCLALAERIGEPVVTADRAWGGHPGVTVIR